MLNVLLSSTMAVEDIENIYLQADSENKILPSKRIVTNAIDAVTLLGRAHQ